jgi:hypothetical protein
MKQQKERHEYTGFWWASYNQEVDVPGTLSFDLGGKLTLTYYGSFPKPPFEKDASNTDDFFGRPKVLPEVILGWAHDDAGWHKITIFETRFRGSSSAGFSEKLARFEVEVRYALIGEHVASQEEAVFYRLETHLSRVADWLNVQPYKFSRKNRDGDEDSALALHHGPDFEMPQLPHIEIVSLGGELSFNTTLHEQNNRKELRYSYSVPLQVKFKNTKTLEEVIDISTALQIFFSLLVGYPVQPITITADLSNQSFQVDDEELVISPQKVDIYYESTLPWTAKQRPDDYELYLLTNYQQVAGKFDELINNWFEQRIKFGRAIAIFNANLNEKNFYANLEFLTMTQALESAHRNLYGESHFSSSDLEKYEEVRRNLVEKLSPDISSGFLQSLKSKLKYLPHDSLRRRITDSCKRTQSVTQNYLFDIDRFAEEVTESRNYFTHYSSEAESKAAHGAELYVLTRQLEILLNALFLKELGTDMHLMERCFLAFPKYQHVIDLKRQLSEKRDIRVEDK